MKRILSLVLVIALHAIPAKAEEARKVPASELDTQSFQVQGLIINNINFVIEKALMGGIKATVQCTVKNKSEADRNYTVYLAGFDKAGALIACFGLEPALNIHEAGKVETLEGSGMVDAGTKGSLDHVLVKVVVQRDE